MMPELQLDLFAASGMDREGLSKVATAPTAFAAAELDDQALVAMIPMAGLREAPTLAAEAGRRPQTTTRQSRARKARARPAPKPRVPPVITTVRAISSESD